MHAVRLHKRLGGVATSYKFSRKSYRALFARVFAVDEPNRGQLLKCGTPADRISVIGNLAIDGALAESSGAYGDPPSDAARDGIVLLPGSRKHEVANLYSLFVAVAVALRRRLGDVPIAFGRSPFTTDAELDAALRAGGDPRAYGRKAELADGGAAIRTGEYRFALVRATMRTAVNARLALSIPGTKLIELAAIGVPSICCLPMNAPELAVINGPLQYLGRLPGIGAPLKRAAAMAVTRRFRYFAQPNIDADRELIPELSGTLFPARVAAVAAERYADREWCERTGRELKARYAAHAGAAKRMSDALLESI
jgi:lipid-A-disaccharide synthase